MSKWKESPSLFELVHQAQSESVHGGIEDDPELPPPAAEPVPQRFPEDEPGDCDSETGGEPYVCNDGERIRFSLSTVAIAVVIMSFAMVMLAAFFIGRQVGAAQARRGTVDEVADGADQLSAVRSQAPQPQVLQGLELVSTELLKTEVHERPADPASVDGWIRGLNYIWIDTFDDAEDAQRAARFLGEAGVECTAVAIPGSSRVRLITNRGFNYADDKAACQEFEARIRDLGRDYMAKGGRYRFDCQVTKLTKSHW